MTITPMDIQNKEFERSFRGYDIEDVDDFLDRVAKDLEQLMRENIDLKEQVKQLMEKNKNYQKLEETMHNAIVVAQETADEVKQAAKREADLVRREAEKEAQRIIEDARYRSSKIVAEKEDLFKQAQVFKMRFRSFIEAQLSTLESDDWLELPARGAGGGEPKRIAEPRPELKPEKAFQQEDEFKPMTDFEDRVEPVPETIFEEQPEFEDRPAGRTEPDPPAETKFEKQPDFGGEQAFEQAPDYAAGSRRDEASADRRARGPERGADFEPPAPGIDEQGDFIRKPDFERRPEVGRRADFERETEPELDIDFEPRRERGRKHRPAPSFDFEEEEDFKPIRGDRYDEDPEF